MGGKATLAAGFLLSAAEFLRPKNTLAWPFWVIAQSRQTGYVGLNRKCARSGLIVRNNFTAQPGFKRKGAFCV